VVEEDEKPGENGGSTRATSVETKLGPTTPQDPPPPEKAETHARLSTGTLQPTTEPVDRPISPSAALPQQICMGVGEGDFATAAVANSFSASPSPLSQPSLAPTPAPEEEEWEIQKIVDKRRLGKGYEYKVRWKDTWLRKSELRNAQRLLGRFEARR